MAGDPALAEERGNPAPSPLEGERDGGGNRTEENCACH